MRNKTATIAACLKPTAILQFTSSYFHALFKVNERYIRPDT